MMYDVPTFAVTAGKKVKLTFSDPDLMPHNLVLVKPGKAEAVGTLALELGARGFEKAFVPDSPEILAATKLVDPSKEDTIHFTCPNQPGEYPFLCTFPGHHQLMRGTMVVRP
jgi:azurin